MRRIHDLTLRLGRETPVYPGDVVPELVRVLDLARGDALTASELRVGCHVGTHLDAPAHFLEDGATVDELPLERLLGPAVVLDLRGRGRIEPDDLEAAGAPEGQHVLLRTDNSERLAPEQFRPSCCYLSEAAAQWLGERGVLSVGFDHYSLDAWGAESFPAHTALARRGVPVFVCLDLRSVPAGRYLFAGLPLRLADAEGSPVRAILLAAGAVFDASPSDDPGVPGPGAGAGRGRRGEQDAGAAGGATAPEVAR